jgi:hypothetical protein
MLQQHVQLFASDPPAGLAFGSLLPVADQASSQPASDLPIYSLFPRPAARDISPRAPFLNPFPGMQDPHSLSQAPEQSSLAVQDQQLQQHGSGGSPANDIHSQQLNSMFMQSSSQSGASQPMQRAGSWSLQQNGGASKQPAAVAVSGLGSAASGGGPPLPLPNASMSMFNAGIYLPYTGIDSGWFLRPSWCTD